MTSPVQRTKFNFAILKLYVNSSNDELVKLYEKHVSQHNQHIKSNVHPNSGFDVFIPKDVFFENMKTQFIDLEIKTEMLYFNADANTIEPTAYYVFPRSSMSKTPLMLSNHTGIIDSGYRGWLIGAFRCLENTFSVEKHTRLLQICHPSLCPVFVQLHKEEELSNTTRGTGGFGSTGTVGA